MMFDIICFCHLRWNFVYQRPQHLLSRFSKHVRVFFFEEPIFDSASGNYYNIDKNAQEVYVITPHLVPGQSSEEIIEAQKSMVDSLLDRKSIEDYMLWYY